MTSAGDLYERLTDSSSGDTLEERFRLYAVGRQIAEIVRTADGDQVFYMHADAIGTVDTPSTDLQKSYPQSFDPFGAPKGTAGSAITRAGSRATSTTPISAWST